MIGVNHFMTDVYHFVQLQRSSLIRMQGVFALNVIALFVHRLRRCVNVFWIRNNGRWGMCIVEKT